MSNGFTLAELREDIAAGDLPEIVTSPDLVDWYGVTRRYANHRLARWARTRAMRRLSTGQYQLVRPRPRKCRRWSGEEVRHMLLMRAAGLPIAAIAKLLDRSVNGVTIALSRTGSGR